MIKSHKFQCHPRDKRESSKASMMHVRRDHGLLDLVHWVTGSKLAILLTSSTDKRPLEEGLQYLRHELAEEA